jgi:hypothetical protein
VTLGQIFLLSQSAESIANKHRTSLKFCEERYGAGADYANSFFRATDCYIIHAFSARSTATLFPIGLAS